MVDNSVHSVGFKEQDKNEKPEMEYPEKQYSSIIYSLQL
jgi:hypothetical protein